jgi:hypothetical protein
MLHVCTPHCAHVADKNPVATTQRSLRAVKGHHYSNRLQARSIISGIYLIRADNYVKIYYSQIALFDIIFSKVIEELLKFSY